MDNLCYLHKRAIARIRSSAHKFPIEVGRYANVPREKRMCSLGCKDIGDEKHFLLECKHPAIRGIYEPLVSKLREQVVELQNMVEGQDGLLHLMASTNRDVLVNVGKLCHRILARYREIMF